MKTVDLQHDIDLDGLGLKKIEELFSQWTEYSNIRFSVNSDWDCSYIDIVGNREETDEEYELRQHRIDAGKKSAEAKRKKKEASERKQLAKLRAKYEGE